MADSSTSVKVAWNRLNNDDANGVITRYRVCYKNASSSRDICNLPVGETSGNVHLKTLYNLEKYTDYVVAVQAATKIGFGPLGANMTRRTMEDMEDMEHGKFNMQFSLLLERCTIFWFYSVCYSRVLNNGLISRMAFNLTFSLVKLHA
jgi:hypothetical protein